MIKELRIQNLRSLEDTGFVAIRPLTILIGGNSAGKSTFLRSFPLFTQTVTKHLRTAIAWFDENLVDFGDFSTSLCNDANENNKSISFSFRFDSEVDDSTITHQNFLRAFRFFRENMFSLLEFSQITVSYQQQTDNKADMCRLVELTLKSGSCVRFEFQEKPNRVSVMVNGKPWEMMILSWRNHGSGSFLPWIERIYDEQSSELYYSIHSELLRKAVEPLKSCCSKRIKHFENLTSLVALWKPDKKDCLKSFQKYKLYSSVQSTIRGWKIDNPVFEDIYNRVLGMFVWSCWVELSNRLANFFINCDYVAPLRAEATRYNRNQGQQINRIDAYGRNLTEFLDSLTPTQRESYNRFVRGTLGVNVGVKNSGGHQSITLTMASDSDEKKAVERNMADVGFGYSQILPIITKLWLMQERKRFNALAFYKESNATALIEQPELHLHPALQAKLADAFVKAAVNEEAKTNIILETHSPTIINRIGRRIREGYLSQRMCT